MAITITITNDNPAQVAFDLVNLQKAIISQTIGMTAPKPTAAPLPNNEPATDVPAGTVIDAPAAEAPKAEKPKATRARKPKAEAAPAEEEPAETEGEASVETPEAPAEVTRGDLVAVIKGLHKQQGDTVLPKVKEILTKYGAAMQSEVKEEDLEDVVAELTKLVKAA